MPAGLLDDTKEQFGYPSSDRQRSPPVSRRQQSPSISNTELLKSYDNYCKLFSLLTAFPTQHAPDIYEATCMRMLAGAGALSHRVTAAEPTQQSTVKVEIASNVSTKHERVAPRSPDSKDGEDQSEGEDMKVQSTKIKTKMLYSTITASTVDESAHKRPVRGKESKDKSRRQRRTTMHRDDRMRGLEQRQRHVHIPGHATGLRAIAEKVHAQHQRGRDDYRQQNQRTVSPHRHAHRYHTDNGRHNENWRRGTYEGY